MGSHEVICPNIGLDCVCCCVWGKPKSSNMLRVDLLMAMERLVPDFAHSEAWWVRPWHLTRDGNCSDIDDRPETEGPNCNSHGLCGKDASNEIWMKGIRNCMALLSIVYYQDLTAYPTLASFLLLFILPLTSTWNSIFTCPSPVKVEFASWQTPGEKSWLVSIRKA